MPLQLITPPAEEPVSLPEAKLHLRVDFDEDDALIAALIRAAREAAETLTGRQFVSARWKMVLDGFPGAAFDAAPAGQTFTLPANAILLSRAPVQSVVAIQYLDAGAAQQTVPASHYTVDVACEPARGQPLRPPRGGGGAPAGAHRFPRIRRRAARPLSGGARMSALGAGALRHRIRVQRPAVVRDALGAPAQTWTDVATVWADIQPLSGREALIARRMAAELTHQITLRYRGEFSDPNEIAQMRVLYRGRVFNIRTALDDGEERLALILLATEGLNDG